jgi:hypothetical protein
MVTYNFILPLSLGGILQCAVMYLTGCDVGEKRLWNTTIEEFISCSFMKSLT